MNLRAARRARNTLGAASLAAVFASLAACSTGGTTAHTASTASKAPASPSAPATQDPMSGPVEPASALPKSCASILGDQDLTSAFGSPQVGDTSYGKYAPLPKIGRTGRVTCGFGIAVDQRGNPGAPVVTVSVITYDQASRALSRVAQDVSDTVGKGATAQPVLVDGHPATVLVEPASMSGSAPAASAAASAAASSSAASPSSGTTADSGVTELLMADGNRTFVITLPLSKLSGSGAVNVLTNLAALVYRHTLPPVGPTATATTATAGPTAS